MVRALSVYVEYMVASQEVTVWGTIPKTSLQLDYRALGDDNGLRSACVFMEDEYSGETVFIIGKVEQRDEKAFQSLLDMMCDFANGY